MAKKTLSESWFRVAHLKPRLAAQARIHRQIFRGEVWHILQDAGTQNFFRMGPGAHRFIGLLDGHRSVHQIWNILNAQLGDDAPTQGEIIRLLSQLHAGNVLLCDFPPDIEQMFERYQKHRAARVKQYLFNPLFARIPLIDPDGFLRRWTPYMKPIVSWWGGLIWLATLAAATGVVLAHWSELTHEATDQLLAPGNLAYLWLTFAFIKGVHELGHGFACRAFGGEVHEMGIMFLVFTPVPYVEASSSWAFPRKSHRLLVAGAGMLAELWVAAIAVFVWVNVEPGLVRSLAYNAIFLASVTTLLFNANPLLRYDGYYILADLLEMPNLRKRASEYLKYLAERHLFGLAAAETTVTTPSERSWCLFYGIGSFIYRVFVCVAILLFVADRFLIVGVILAAMAAFSWGVVPICRNLRYLLTDPRLAPVRGRAVFATALAAAAVLIPVGLLPVPLASRSEGVVHLPEHTVVRAWSAGFVESVRAKPGDLVQEDEVLLVCRNPELETALERVKAGIQEMEGRYRKRRIDDRVKAENFRHQKETLVALEAELAKRVADLRIKSPAAGRFVLPRADDLPGRFLEEGAEVGRVVDLHTVVVRTAVRHSEIDLVRSRLKAVEVRLAGDVSFVYTAEVEREVPAGRLTLPSPVLGILGGGEALVDPADPSGATTLDPYFVLDLRVRGKVPTHVGERVYVRFDLGHQPMLQQWGRSLRQLLMDRFEL